MLSVFRTRAEFIYLFLLFSCSYPVIYGVDVRKITVSDANKLTFTDVQEGSPPSIFFILGNNCVGECEDYETLLNSFSSGSLYTGAIYVIYEDQLPWDSLGKAPAILLANEERKLAYYGPLEYRAFQDTVNQFSNGARAARLDDRNFEHDTQASTGATTGRWLIIFDEITEQSMFIHDSVTLYLRSKGISVGVVDPRHSLRSATRFQIQPVPVTPETASQLAGLLVLRNSRLHRFPTILYRSDHRAVIQFAVSQHERYPSKVIPRPRKLFDEVIDSLVKAALSLERHYGHKWLTALIVFLLTSAALLLGLLIVSCVWYSGGFDVDSQVNEAITARHKPSAAGDTPRDRFQRAGRRKAD